MSDSEEANSSNDWQRGGSQHPQVDVVGIPFHPELDSYSWCLTKAAEDTVRHSFVWAIEKFSERSEYRISSSEFSVRIRDDLVSKWRLEMDLKVPDVVSDELSSEIADCIEDGQIPVFLCSLSNLDFDYKLKYELSILDIDRRLAATETKTYLNPKNHRFMQTFGKYDIIEDKADYLPNDTLTLVCNLSIKLPDSAWQNMSGCKRSQGTTGDGVSIKQLQQQLTAFAGQAHLSPNLSDCKIVCEGEELSCHTFVLAARSPVFRAMFTTAGLKEATTRRVEIDSMKLEVVKDMISFLYTGVKPELATGDEGAVEQLLDAAEQYQIDDLKVICEDRLISKMKVDNAVDHLILGDRYAAQNLKKEAICFILRNMTKVVDTASWKEKLYKLPNLMTEILLAEKNRDDQGPSASKRPRI